MHSLFRWGPGVLAAALLLSACGAPAASAPASHTPRRPASHHSHHAPAPSPLAALRLTVTHATVGSPQSGDTGQASYPATLTVTVTNPTAHAVTITSGDLSTYAPAFSNTDTQTVPPLPSLFPLTAATDTIQYLDNHWETLTLTIPPHGTVSGTITTQISHAHGSHTLYLMTRPFNVSTAAATGSVATTAPFST